MEIPEVTVIEIKKKYKNILINHIKRQQLKHRIVEDSNGKLRVEVHELTAEDAFNLGAKTQAQLLDGESLF
ncbi:MAG: hypothetical protein ACLFPE_10045 [Bacteroidales bacterium]